MCKINVFDAEGVSCLNDTTLCVSVDFIFIANNYSVDCSIVLLRPQYYSFSLQ